MGDSGLKEHQYFSHVKETDAFLKFYPLWIKMNKKLKPIDSILTKTIFELGAE